MEQTRMHVVDAMRQAERRTYEGRPTEREERPEYQAAKVRHADLHIQSETAALTAEISRGRHSTRLSQPKRAVIMAALADSGLSILEIADQFKVNPATVETLKAELDKA